MPARHRTWTTWTSRGLSCSRRSCSRRCHLCRRPTPRHAGTRCSPRRIPAQLRRVRAAKERRARSGANAAPRQASSSFETADEAAPAARATSLSDALSEALGLKPGAALTALGRSQVSFATAHGARRCSPRCDPPATPGHSTTTPRPCRRPTLQHTSQLHGSPFRPTPARSPTPCAASTHAAGSSRERGLGRRRRRGRLCRAAQQGGAAARAAG